MSNKLELMKEMRNDAALLVAADALTIATAEYAKVAPQVWAVQAQVLAEIEVLAAPRRTERLGAERITRPDDIYLSEDEAALSEYYEAVDARLRAAGLKPDDMEFDYCPALIARGRMAECEDALIDLIIAHLSKHSGATGFTHRNVHGESRKKFIAMALGFLTAEWDQE